MVLIAGCRTLVPLDADLDADFRLRGKIGVRGVDTRAGASNGGAFSASFDWVQTPTGSNCGDRSDRDACVLRATA